MATYNPNTFSATEIQALQGIVSINLESKLTANVIDMFRNVFPSVRDYMSETIAGFAALDETDATSKRAVRTIQDLSNKFNDLNFATTSHILLQTPEGFKDRYVPYLTWLLHEGIGYIEGSKKVLDNYYQELAVFISNRDAKISNIDHTRMYAEMEKLLGESKEGLASFFDASSTTALAPLQSLFDRAQDIHTSGKLSIELNRKRMAIKPEATLKQANAISELLNMLVDSTANKDIPEVSGNSAKSIAQGALVAAHYVEFVGVIHYRIEEALNALAIAVEQISREVKK